MEDENATKTDLKNLHCITKGARVILDATDSAPSASCMKLKLLQVRKCKRS